MRLSRHLLAALALLLLGGRAALAQDTATPTNTPTPTVTPTARVALAVTGYAASVPITSNGAQDITETFSYVTGGSMALGPNEIINLVKLPKGATITGWYLRPPDIDSGTTLTLDFGLASNTSLLLHDSTIGQAGGVASPKNAPNGLVTNAIPAAILTADDVLVLKATAPAAGAGAGGTLNGWVRYHMHGRAF